MSWVSGKQMWTRGGKADSRHREHHVQGCGAPTQRIQGMWVAEHDWNRDVGTGWEVGRGGEAEETDKWSVLRDLVGHLGRLWHAPWASSLGITWKLVRNTDSQLTPDLLNHNPRWKVKRKLYSKVMLWNSFYLPSGVEAKKNNMWTRRIWTLCQA